VAGFIRSIEPAGEGKDCREAKLFVQSSIRSRIFMNRPDFAVGVDRQSLAPHPDMGRSFSQIRSCDSRCPVPELSDVLSRREALDTARSVRENVEAPGSMEINY
jgi:hypothetical protein